MAAIMRILAFPCAAFLLAAHARPGGGDATSRCAAARANLEVAARILARQKKLHAAGEPQRDLDEARRDYDAKARALASCE